MAGVSARRSRLGIAALACAAAMAVSWGAAHVSALYAWPDIEQVPVDRLVTNLTALAAKSPTDVNLVINLARVHAMAYATRNTTLRIPKGRPELGPFVEVGRPDHYQFQVNRGGSAAAAKAAVAHLANAIQTYERAIKLAPDNAIAHLGYGWALAEAGKRAEAVAALRRTVALSWPRDQKGTSVMHEWRSVTEEAARYLLPLLDPAKDKDEIADVRVKVAQLQRMPRAITPIAIPLRDGAAVEDLVTRDRRVLFDADGTGLVRRWSWITPDAAWLVYDQRGRGEIRSALQLFGSVTFWLFWDTGYDALRALDDDGDGELCGSELRHLALWHDRDSDGVSDAGEVRPLAAWNIVSLSTTFAIEEDHPAYVAWSPAGVRYQDGSVRPTFDVILHAPRH